MTPQFKAVARKQSAQSVSIAAHATMEYVMPSLSNKLTGTVFSVQPMPGLHNELTVDLEDLVCRIV